jgi:hypothetical protein
MVLKLLLLLLLLVEPRQSTFKHTAIMRYIPTALADNVMTHAEPAGMGHIEYIIVSNTMHAVVSVVLATSIGRC